MVNNTEGVIFTIQISIIEKARNSFGETGIHPFNPATFSNEDFEPTAVIDLILPKKKMKGTFKDQAVDLMIMGLIMSNSQLRNHSQLMIHNQ